MLLHDCPVRGIHIDAHTTLMHTHHCVDGEIIGAETYGFHSLNNCEIPELTCSIITTLKFYGIQYGSIIKKR
jgi:hypothetical protein